MAKRGVNKVDKRVSDPLRTVYVTSIARKNVTHVQTSCF